jgi:uncharacterized protein YegL
MPKTKTKTTKRQTKKETPSILNVALVWDMSGSMGSVYGAAIEGAGQYMADLRKDENTENIRMSITIFDTVFERWYEDALLSEIPANFTNRYQPRGMTALNDAVADAIVSLDERMKGDRAEERALVVVLTDGLENSSREYGGVNGAARLAELIKSYEDTGRWTFVYLGTGKPADVAAVAQTYNIPVANTMSYEHDSAGTEHVFAAASGVTRTLSHSKRGQTVTAMADAGYKSTEEQEEEGK